MARSSPRVLARTARALCGLGLCLSLLLSSTPVRAQLETSLIVGALEWIGNFIVSYGAGKALDYLIEQGRIARGQLRREHERLRDLPQDPETTRELFQIEKVLYWMGRLIDQRPTRDEVNQINQAVQREIQSMREQIRQIEGRTSELEETTSELKERMGRDEEQLVLTQQQLANLQTMVETPHYQDPRLGAFLGAGVLLGSTRTVREGEALNSTPGIFAFGAVLRGGERWIPHASLGAEITYTAASIEAFRSIADTTVRADPPIWENEMTFAATLNFYGTSGVPLTVFGGPAMDVVFSQLRDPSTSEGRGRIHYQYTSAFAWVVGAGFEFQRQLKSGEFLYARFHQSQPMASPYQSITHDPRRIRRTQIVGGVGVTFQ